MEFKGKYELSYTLNRVLTHMVLNVELTQNPGLLKPGQNVWSGHATLDGSPFTEADLSHCVNARIAAEKIGKKLRDRLKLEAKAEGKSFRIKKEETT